VRKRVYAMKTIDLRRGNYTIDELLELVAGQSILLRSKSGSEFILEVADAFDREVAALGVVRSSWHSCKSGSRSLVVSRSRTSSGGWRLPGGKMKRILRPDSVIDAISSPRSVRERTA
jgi:hypothetical protein